MCWVFESFTTRLRAASWGKLKARGPPPRAPDRLCACEVGARERPVAVRRQRLSISAFLRPKKARRRLSVLRASLRHAPPSPAFQPRKVEACLQRAACKTSQAVRCQRQSILAFTGPKKISQATPWGRRGSRLHASPSAYQPRASKLALSAPPPPHRRRCVASGNFFQPLHIRKEKLSPTPLSWRKASLLHASPSACQPRASKLALSAPPSARNRRCAFLISKGRNRMPLATQRLSVACNRQVIEGRCVASGNLFLHSQIQKKAQLFHPTTVWGDECL